MTLSLSLSLSPFPSPPTVCKYYAHARCKGKAFNNCKHCATYTHGKAVDDKHHWVEGNLPSSARCWVCAKSCSTTECLSSFKCGWCGISVSVQHAIVEK